MFVIFGDKIKDNVKLGSNFDIKLFFNTKILIFDQVVI